MPQITGTLSSSGDSSALITAGTSAIQVMGMQLYINNSAITVTVKTGSTVRFTCSGLASVITAIQPPPATKEPLIQGLVGEDLKINLSGAGTVNYNLQYVLK